MAFMITIILIIAGLIWLVIHKENHACPYDNGPHTYELVTLKWSAFFGHFEVGEECSKCGNQPRIPFYNSINQEGVIVKLRHQFNITARHALEVIRYIKARHNNEALSLQKIRDIVEQLRGEIEELHQ